MFTRPLLVEISGIEPEPRQCPDIFGGSLALVDPRRIELLPRQCECRVIPFYYGPAKNVVDPRFSRFLML